MHSEFAHAFNVLLFPRASHDVDIDSCEVVFAVVEIFHQLSVHGFAYGGFCATCVYHAFHDDRVVAGVRAVVVRQTYPYVYVW